MRMLALKCDSCGAPLDLPADSAEIECLYCSNRIWIEDSTPRQKPAPPKPPPADAASKKVTDEIAQLDREWEAYRATYLTRDEKGQYNIPVEEHCRIGMWATVIIGAIVMLAGVVWEPLVVPFTIVVLIVMGVTLMALKRQINIARVYARSKRNYEHERMRLHKALPA